MAKKSSKKKEEKQKRGPNDLKLRPWINFKGQRMAIEKFKFFGVNGRFGATNKPYTEFSFDELVEFWRSHDHATRSRYLTGIIPKDYVGPFDKAIKLPVKPVKVEDGKEENVND